MQTYREMPADELFAIEWVKGVLPAEELPGYKGGRIVCSDCGEGTNFRREVVRDGKVFMPSLFGRALLRNSVTENKAGKRTYIMLAQLKAN
jgi:formylmethanofuran dehydrogenase subunit E